MNQSAALRRLMAWHSGSVCNRREFLPIPAVADDEAFITAFVRVGGENTPCGIAYGYADWDEPKILSIPEPRNRDDVANLVINWGQTLLRHIGHPSVRGGTDENAFRRQLWLPGASHLGMLQLLAYGFSYVRRGHPERIELMRQIGRTCGYLFREAIRPGQISVIDANDLLRECYVIPADEFRQQHLGFNLAWVENAGNRDQKIQASEEAEKLSVSVTLDPRLEREELVKRVERFGTLDPKSQAARSIASEIHEILHSELLRRWDLTKRARILLIRNRPENPELKGSIELSQSEFESQYLRFERDLAKTPDAFFPNPETEHNPRAAAARFFSHIYSDEWTHLTKLHGDPQLVEDEVERGDAFRGVIVEVEDEGEGRRSRPVWFVSSAIGQKLRLREGTKVCVLGFARRTARIRRIRVSMNRRIFEVEIVDQRTRPRNRSDVPDARDERALVGSEVAFVKVAPGYNGSSKSWKVWNQDVPGAWLTHAAAPQPASNQNLCQSNLVDFVEGLGGH